MACAAPLGRPAPGHPPTAAASWHTTAPTRSLASSLQATWGRTTQVRPQPSRHRWQACGEGVGPSAWLRADWEHVTARLTPDGSALLGVYYSAHRRAPARPGRPCPAGRPRPAGPVWQVAAGSPAVQRQGSCTLQQGRSKHDAPANDTLGGTSYRHRDGKWRSANELPRTPDGRVQSFVAINGHGSYAEKGVIPKIFFAFNDRTSDQGALPCRAGRRPLPAGQVSSCCKAAADTNSLAACQPARRTRHGLPAHRTADGAHLRRAAVAASTVPYRHPAGALAASPLTGQLPEWLQSPPASGTAGAGLGHAGCAPRSRGARYVELDRSRAVLQ